MTDQLADPVGREATMDFSPQVLWTRLFVKSVISTKTGFFISKEFKSDLLGLMKNLMASIKAHHSQISGVAKGGTIAAGFTLLYWLGCYAGLTFFPPIGFAVAVLGAAGVTSGYKLICDSQRNYEFIKVYYSCLLLLEAADNVFSDQEKKMMGEFVASLPLNDRERSDLLATKIPKLEELQIPNWLSEEQKRTILLGCWSLVYCDGVAPVETDLFGRLGGKFGFDPREIEEIKSDAQRSIESLEQAMVDAGAVACKLMPKENKAIENRIIELLTSLSIKIVSPGEIEERFRAKLKSEGLFKELEKDPPAFETVLAGAYIMGKGLFGGEDFFASSFTIHFVETADRIGRQREGREFLKTVDEIHGEFQALG